MLARSSTISTACREVRRSAAARRMLSTQTGLDAPPSDSISRMELYNGMPLGTGGRHSRGGHNIAVFGATGFLGTYVVNELAKTGNNLVVTTRGDDMTWRHLKLCADYGKLVASYIDTKDEESIRETIRGCDTVVNLMGKYYETKHFVPSIINCSFRDVHVDAAATVARIAREEDCKHLVHVSCAYANADSASEFARTKAEGDAKVAEEFPGAVIVKPNVLYGEEDRFLQLYAQVSSLAPAVPLVGGGDASVNPVYVGDAARGIATAATNFATAGTEFNLSGKDTYSHKQVWEYVMDQIGHKKDFVEVPNSIAMLVGKLRNLLPYPEFTHDTIKLMHEDCPAPQGEQKGFDALGIHEIADFETKAFKFLYSYRAGGHYADLKQGKA
ncbi:NADH dehydrogenase ubiquinone 1 alpha subcomplex subunit 9, mitochondrial [Hondaea fermentalgiana]|uniref:NADH dehydrogenase ubiquinone 1 alpha subcomplex subunit 9, mitochondrial n=1 Tax=Hondaea fermentalgiana TaxID=2315210 RepID=A0A2R5G349_9STRA|nr:NADH dehydrogenase ubiquinone 1 alpha subcomplex subunit 9, mitochondrial [Hondaea fermentalgiana]|eukprot:GBG24955.1 NADH dehydrogenase ubiquinone 1 alpha subcomplex subunit 9, mitochondrial [Hondaea fermentalgiana]